VKNNKIKIARIVTVPFVFVQNLDLLDALVADSRFELHIVTAEGQYLKELKERYPQVIFHLIEIPREINLIKDIRSLIQLTLLFFKEGFVIVHSQTPKAGVVTALAGFLSFTPVRIHTFTGQVWVTLSGVKRTLLVFLDKMIGFLNTQNYSDSFGQNKLLLQNGIGKANKLSVLHKGSCGGINISRFDPRKLSNEISKIRLELFPGFNGKVLMYLGRLNKEKGLIELGNAFIKLKEKHSLKLLLVGPVESEDNIEFQNFISQLRSDKDTVFVSFTNYPEYYLGAGDIFCLPSYREGFGTVALEASAMEKPVVASNIYGLSEAVADKESGLLFEVKNTADLILKLDTLLSDEKFSLQLGRQGRERVIKDFSQQILTKSMLDEYFRLVGHVTSM